jgi:cell volume regulation protein A
LVFPDRLLSIIPIALLLTLVLILIARPLAVWLTLLPLYRLTSHYRFDWQEQGLLMWAGLKGAVPIILATLPLLEGVPNGERIFNIVFVVVIVATTLQGLTVVPLARFLGLTRPEPPTPPLRLELGGETPPGSAIHDVFLEPEHRLVGRALEGTLIPAGVVVAAIYREGALVATRGSTVFQAGDHVYFLSSGENARLDALLARREDLQERRARDPG